MDLNKPIITISLEKPTEDDIDRIYEIYTSNDTEKFLTEYFKVLQSKVGVKILVSSTLFKQNNAQCIAKEVGILRLINARIERPSALTGQEYATEDTVGVCHITYNQQYPNTLNLFYVIDAKYRARGIGTWAVREIIRYIKEELFTLESIDNVEFSGCIPAQMTVSRIEIDIADGNIASMKVAEKNGFEPEGVARKAIKVNGEFVDCTVYSLIPEKPIEIQFKSKEVVPEKFNKEELEIPKPEPLKQQQQPLTKPTEEKTEPTKQQHLSELDKALKVLDNMEQQTERNVTQTDQHMQMLNNYNNIVRQAVKNNEQSVQTTEQSNNEQPKQSTVQTTVTNDVKSNNEQLEQSTVMNDLAKIAESEELNDEPETDNNILAASLSDLLSSMMNEVKEETEQQCNNIEQISINSTVEDFPHEIINTVVNVEEKQEEKLDNTENVEFQKVEKEQPQTITEPLDSPKEDQETKPVTKISLKGLTVNSVRSKKAESISKTLEALLNNK